MTLLQFPDGFQWGAATASYQIEGAAREDGKGTSIWDRFAHTPGTVRDGDTGDVACDHYHRCDEDVAIMRELGLTSYRFSLAWPRIQPEGKGPANTAGLDFYSKLVDRLLAAGIRPSVTLYHWDLPQALEDAGGWPARDTAGRFADYAEIAVRALGDRVKHWMIFNEPKVFTVFGYLLGIHAPGRRDREAFLRATHTVNLAQAEAYRAMKACSDDAVVGSVVNLSPCEPASDSEADLEATTRWHRFCNAWFLDPPLRGRYPEAFVDGLPEQIMGIQEDDAARMRAPLDFIGVNHYTRSFVQAAPGSDLGALPVLGREQGPRTDFGWEVWPDSLYDTLMWVTREYDRPWIEVTENGCAYGDAPGPDGRVRDARRTEFYRGFLASVHRAIADGADVRGYHAWSLLDNFEWAEGYSQRFGIVWCDFESGERIVKDSGRWYGEVARANAVRGD